MSIPQIPALPRPLPHLLLTSLLLVACASSGESRGEIDAFYDGWEADAPSDASPDALLEDSVSDTGGDGGDFSDLPDDSFETSVPASTPWSAELTHTVEDLQFIEVDGHPFFALGIHASAGLTYDGIAGPGECDKGTQTGYLDINIEKTREAAAAGANFAYMWGYDARSPELLDVTPQFKGCFHPGYASFPSAAQDVIPILLNRYGEVDLDGFDADDVVEMAGEMADFLTRTGAYSPENLPNLPPLEQVGHMAWHPTFRMIGNGDGNGEMLTSEEADSLAQALNMMIGDTYTYVENRFDLSIPGDAVMAALTGQKGDIKEGYDDWIAMDDPEHRSMFDSGFQLAHSLRVRGKPDAVVWMWLQGYSFGRSIRHSLCRGEADDSWASGAFPPLKYLVKEATSMIAAGATGIIFFGFPDTLPEEAEVIHTFFRALSADEVYAPILLSPRLDLGIDTTFMGEPGYDGRGRVHAVVKWDEFSRTAAIVAANPGARETTVEFPFPWSLAKAEILDWETGTFAQSDALVVDDSTLRMTLSVDSGVIVRVTPLMPTPTPAFCEPNTAPFPVRPVVRQPATLPFLHVDGPDILDDAGNPVALRGINFGSWLMMETWVAGIGETNERGLLEQLRNRAAELGLAALLQQAEDQTALDWLLERRSHYPLVMEWRSFMTANASLEQVEAVEELWDWFLAQPWVEEEESLWKWFQGRFGYASTEELRLAFQRSYITELDVERVANLGLNLIRVPIWYRSLETDSKGDTHFRAEGWKMLHQLALWARKHQVYLMLDLHGAPGGQSTSWHQGLTDGGYLWERPECIARTAHLWQALARYFADDPHIAVYDLLNEPVSFLSVEDYAAVHDELYNAIRAVDSDHIVMIEDGYRPFTQLRSPAEMGWENAMFSIHLYSGGDSAADYLDRFDQNLVDLDSFYLDRFACPLFLGEFSGADGNNSLQWAQEGTDGVLERLNARGIHWAPWTWKYYAQKVWGLYHPIVEPGTRIEIVHPSFAQLLETFGALTSEHFEADSAYEEVLKKNATAPPAPLFLGHWQGD